ncbi:DUF7553 family protein [Halorientalis marina]|uniref:DUF7553 family protein n=1 Tax=Halorientalis marina TaxID=2931976 RepID=UPI001FF1C1FC|nr:hypothetical protein [Halorientalis marina]
MRGTRTHKGGLHKANEQLLLAAKLTFETERAKRLADLAHQVGELADAGRPDPSAVETVERQLRDLRADAHDDVRGAIDRATDLLAASRGVEAA